MKYDICVFGGCALDSFYYKNEKGEIPEVPSLVLPGIFMVEELGAKTYNYEGVNVYSFVDELDMFLK